MKIRMEVLIEAVKRVIEAGKEEELKELSRKNGFFVTAKKSLVKQTKSQLIKSTLTNLSDADRDEVIDSLSEFDDCRT